MKRMIITALIVALTVTAFAQEFKVTGEVKTGVLWTKTENQITPPVEYTSFNSKDDAGSFAGRFRLNVEYSQNNLGFKARLNWEQWNVTGGAPYWAYAFGYSNLFDDQLTLSAGKLGASPWGTGGPEMWKELEAVSNTGGIRFEIKPNIVPGLNAGFVLNDFNGSMDTKPASKPITFLDILEESVLGVSYTHDLFHIRFAYRLDSDLDGARNGASTGKDGGELVYRVEEYALKNYLPYFSIWTLGYWTSLGADEENRQASFKSENWLFFQYAPDLFTAQIRFGYDAIWNRSVFHVKPTFYINLFDNFINAGGSFWYAQDFGDGKIFKDSPYSWIEIEPKIQINFNPSVYAAIAYNWRTEYVKFTTDHADRGIKEPIKQTQWLNLRVGIIL